MARRALPKLTSRQRMALWAMSDQDARPITAAGLAMDLPGHVSADAARGALARLERRGLVKASYTGNRTEGRHYELTAAGRAAADDIPDPETD